MPLLLASAPANAAPPSGSAQVRLEYERGPGAETCPEETELRGDVAAELGHDPFRASGPRRFRATVTRRKKSGPFVATGGFVDKDGATAGAMDEMVSPDCRKLVGWVAVWVAAELTHPPPQPPALPAPPPQAPPLAVPPPAAPPPAFRLRLGAAAGLELGVGPTPTPLMSLNLALQSTTVPMVSLAVEMRTDFPLPATLPDGQHVHALVVTGSLLTCFHALDKGLLSFCPMFSAGVISTGERRSTADARGIYSAAGARIGAAIPLSWHHVAFTVTGDVLGTLHPFQLVVDDRPIWQTGPLGGALQAGFSTLF